jgi:hypothetical protein
MKETYLQDVLRRAGELAVLDRAAAVMPDRVSAGKWILAAALGVVSILYPAVSAAQVLTQLI